MEWGSRAHFGKYFYKNPPKKKKKHFGEKIPKMSVATQKNYNTKCYNTKKLSSVLPAGLVFFSGNGKLKNVNIQLSNSYFLIFVHGALIVVAPVAVVLVVVARQAMLIMKHRLRLVKFYHFIPFFGFIFSVSRFFVKMS